MGVSLVANGVRAYLRPSGQYEPAPRSVPRDGGRRPSRGAGGIARGVDELAGRTTGRRGVVFLFSDLLDDVPDILAGLQHLRYQKHEVVLFHTLDAAELDFPFRHTTLFRGLEGLPEVLTDPRSIRDSTCRRFTRTPRRSRPAASGWKSTTSASAPTRTSATTSPRTCRSGTGG